MTVDAEATQARINKLLNKDVLRRGDDSVFEIEKITSGSLGLDRALWGGLPLGRMAMYHGRTQSGKTTMAYNLIAEVQRQGKLAAFFDLERSYNPKWAAKWGVDTENLLVSPVSAASVLTDLAKVAVHDLGIIVVDTIPMMIPPEELNPEKDSSAPVIGKQSIAVGRFIRDVNEQVHNCLILFVNQERDDPGSSMGGMWFGAKPKKLPGGNALMFSSRVRVEFKQVGQIKEGKVVVGQKVKCIVHKNSWGPPHTTAEFQFFYDGHIDLVDEIAVEATKVGVVKLTGAWYKYGGQKWQGIDAFREALAEDVALRGEIEKLTREEIRRFGK
jgi:recombination protein RecA